MTVAAAPRAQELSGVRTLGVVTCLALPWLWPLAPGPSGAVAPWLIAAACTLLAFLLCAPASPPRSWSIAAAALVALAVLRPASAPLDAAALAGACALVLAAVAIGRGRLDAEGPGLANSAADAWLAAAVLSACIALLQYFDAAGALAPWLHAAGPGEAVGNLRQPNQLASLLAIGFAALLWHAARGHRLALWLAFAVLLSVANAATSSRTGLLHWVVLALLAVSWPGPARRRRAAIAIAALAAYGVAAWALPLALEAFTGHAAPGVLQRVTSDLGCSSRRILWANVLQLLAQKPFVGWGWGELDFAHYQHLYGQAPRFCDILDNAHNLPLHVAVELGVPAALLLCGAVLWGVWRGRPWAQRRPEHQLAWAVLAVLALHSLLEYPLWYGPFQLALGLSIGLLLPQVPRGAAVPVLRRTVVGLAGLSALVYAAWDYARVTQPYLAPAERHPAWRADAQAAASRSWLFAAQARFAALVVTPLTPANAEWVHATAGALLHYSPEPRIIERAIEAATMQGRYDEAVLHLARYRAAFPSQYARWRVQQDAPIPRRLKLDEFGAKR